MSYKHFKNITIQQLETLIELVEAGSFTGAARRMRLSQPTLTKHVKHLEDMAGTHVVVRTNAGISLTPEGRILYDHARRICRIRDEAHDKIQIMRNQESGAVFICASNIPSTYILPRLLGRFKKLHPEIHLHIQAGDSGEALERVLTGQAEIGFIGNETHEKKLHVEPLWKDNLVLAAQAGCGPATAGALTPEELATLPFIIRERGSGTRETLEHYLQGRTGKSLADFNIVSEMGSTEAIKEAIIAGVGMSIISDQAVERERGQGIISVIPIDHFSIERKFYLIYKKQLNLMAYHRRFLSFVRSTKTIDR
ncbi:MAG: LysR family transcriptional regulator [Deltaproteobacteria bacterium]|nr:LysR family transcriptional regulator [Deltaproteobacteria bacterium]